MSGKREYTARIDGVEHTVRLTDEELCALQDMGVTLRPLVSEVADAHRKLN